jgi:antirestriction protein ArdC
VTTTDKASALLAELKDGIEHALSEDGWREYLAVGARFHRYSLNNVILIHTQRPDATRVAGFRLWQSLGRQVRKGEKGIAILAPVVRKVEEDSGEQSRAVVGFRCAHVFDVAQTDGEPLPDPVLPQELDGEAPAALAELERFVGEIGFTLRRGDAGAANGWMDAREKLILVSDALDPATAFKTLVHEVAHALVHVDAGVEHGLQELEAESCAFVVCKALGLDASRYSFRYLASWSGGDPEQVMKAGERALRAADRILGALSKEAS